MSETARSPREARRARLASAAPAAPRRDHTAFPNERVEPVRLRAIAFAFPIALAGCGGSDGGPSPPADDGAGRLLFAGSTCEETILFVLDSPEAAPTEPPPEDLIDCTELPRTDLAPSGLRATGTGELVFDGATYAPDTAIRVEDRPDDDSALRPSTRLILHDGETRVLRRTDSAGTARTDYGVYDARASLSFTVYPAGGGTLFDRVYDLTPALDPDTPALVGRDVATDAVLIVDLDGDGAASVGEFIVLSAGSAGQIVWSGARETFSLSVNLVLEDGRSVEASYEGGAELVE